MFHGKSLCIKNPHPGTFYILRKGFVVMKNDAIIIIIFTCFCWTGIKHASVCGLKMIYLFERVTSWIFCAYRTNKRRGLHDKFNATNTIHYSVQGPFCYYSFGIKVSPNEFIFSNFSIVFSKLLALIFLNK